MMYRRFFTVSGSCLAVVVLASVWMVRGGHPSSPPQEIDPAIDPAYERFMQPTSENEKEKMLESGDLLFRTLFEEKPGNPVLTLVSRRLSTAEQIRTLVTRGVKSNQPELLEGIPGAGDLGLPLRGPKDTAAPASLLPPAREVYWTHLKIFADEPGSSGLTAQQIAFCRRYYDLRMQELSMEIGRRMVVVDPNCSENVCYALVLPLLHLHGRDEDWEQAKPLLALFSPAMLEIQSKFALLQIERPQAAMAVAQYRAEVMGGEFSSAEWALEAADACAANHRPDLAERLLSMVVARTGDQDRASRLQLKVVESYAQCRDYQMAAQACDRILVGLADTALYGKIRVMRLGYLARENEIERVIAETELARNDSRCEPQRTQVLYLRWWALGKANRPEEAAAIARQLMEQYPRDRYVAPILLERATDALARQDYGKCGELLARLTSDFPETESAKKAEHILNRLKGGQVE